MLLSRSSRSRSSAAVTKKKSVAFSSPRWASRSPTPAPK
jgi:hypothetical protein